MSARKSYLTGDYRVRVTRWALREADKLLPRKRDRAELRRQALKLRFWPKQDVADSRGQLLDLDWSWIRSLPNKRVGELRIHDAIGGCDNLRIIFYVGDAAKAGNLPEIWILTVVQKKRQDFSRHEIATFDARRTLVIERFCK